MLFLDIRQKTHKQNMKHLEKISKKKKNKQSKGSESGEGSTRTRVATNICSSAKVVLEWKLELYVDTH